MHDSSPSYNTNQSDYENRVESATNDENPITEAVNADSPEQITEVANAVAVRKNYNMGRYDHEGGWIAEDERTVYLSDDRISFTISS